MSAEDGAGSPHPHRGPALGIFAWVMFDWATQPFFTLLLTFIFAPYFAAHLAATPAGGQAIWGYATALAGLAIAFLSPPVGAIADAAGRRKPWIVLFSVMLVVGSSALWFAAPGATSAIAVALTAYVIGTIGVEFATVFTNAMMTDLVDEKRLGRLSGMGWGIGYLGGLVSLVLMLGFFVAEPDNGRTLLGFVPVFGLDPATFGGDRASGPFSAIWYVIFVLPLFLFTPDTPKRMALKAAVRTGIANLRDTTARLLRDGNTGRFLIARMVYSDGLIALFAFGGIYAAGTFGWSAIQLGIFGILLTITGTVGAIVGGRLDDRLGSKRVITGALTLLVLCGLAILSIDRTHILFVVPVAPPDTGTLFGSAGERLYLVIGAVIGAVAGPLQSASRTLMARIAPRDSMTEFFGFYALSGKLTSFAGPFAVGVLTSLSGSQRVGISVLLAFFIVGGLLLLPVRADRAIEVSDRVG